MDVEKREGKREPYHSLTVRRINNLRVDKNVQTFVMSWLMYVQKKERRSCKRKVDLYRGKRIYMTIELPSLKGVYEGTSVRVSSQWYNEFCHPDKYHTMN